MKRSFLIILGLLAGVSGPAFCDLKYSAVQLNPVSLPAPGSNNYIQNTNSLQAGATFYVSSGTVNGRFNVANGGAIYLNGTDTIDFNLTNSESETFGTGIAPVGGENLTIGYNAGIAQTSGAQNNVIIGNASAGSITSGSQNTIIGVDAEGLNSTGSNNVMLGYGTGSNDANRSNNTYVGYGAGSNGVVNGGSGVTAIGYNVNAACSNCTVLGSNPVGIGTTAPATLLHLSSGTLTLDGNMANAINISTGSLQLNGASGTSGYALTSQGAGVTPIWQAVSGGSFINNQNSLQAGATFYVSSGTVNGQTILAATSGNVGIGLSSPGNLLDVAGTISTELSAGTNFISLLGQISSPALIYSGTLRIGSGTYNGSSFTQLAQFTNTGRFGVGNSAPGTNALFTVGTNATADNLAYTQLNSGATTNKALVVQGVASQTADLLQFQDNTAKVLSFVNSSGYVGVATNTLATNALFQVGGGTITALSNGNVGIGTTLPATKLHLSSGVFTLDGTTPAVNINNYAGTNYLLSVSSSTLAPYTIAVSSTGAVGSQATTAISVATCGTGSPTVAGSNQNGLITTGTAATACTLNFTPGYFKNAPTCILTDNSATITPNITSLSNSALVIALGAGLTGGNVWYICAANLPTP